MQEKTSLVLVDKRGFFHGGDGGIRTLDLTDANRTLSQLSYAPKSLSYFIILFGVCKALK